MFKKAFFVAAALALSVLVGSAVRASHNTVTVTVTSSTRNLLTGTVRITNTTATPQTGEALTLVVFKVKRNGRVEEQFRQTLNAPDLPANGEATVNFSIQNRRVLRQRLRRGTFIVLADYQSSIGGNLVQHTHCGTATIDRGGNDNQTPF